MSGVTGCRSAWPGPAAWQQVHPTPQQRPCNICAICIWHSHVSPPSSTSFKYISTCHLVRHLIRQCRVSAVVPRCLAHNSR